MKYIALLWDRIPAKIAKRDLPLLPLSSTFHSFPVLHTLNSSHSYLMPSVSQFSADTVRIPTVGLKGGRRKFSISCDPWQLQWPARTVPRTGLTLRRDPLTDQLSLVLRTTPRFHFWKKRLLMDWNVTKGWIWFVQMKPTACFWRVHWGGYMLQKSIRKGDVFVSRSQLPQFLIQQEAGWIMTESRSLLLYQINTQLEVLSLVYMKLLI